MKRAGIDRIGPTGEKRVFHSFRHTFARVALENGAELTWLSRHLGHSGTESPTRYTGTGAGMPAGLPMTRLEGAFTV